MKLDELLREVSRSANLATADRATALKATIKGCRSLEAALLAALGQEPLRGLPDIGATRLRVYAARLRTRASNRLPAPNNPYRSQDRYLVINAHGLLTLYWWEGEDLCDAEAQDADLRVGDLETMIRTLKLILPLHLQHTARTSARYSRAKQLGERLEEVLTGKERASAK
jgi:hypothetical protein